MVHGHPSPKRNRVFDHTLLNSSNNSLAQQQLITNGSSASTPAPPAGVGEDSSAPSSLSVASSTAAESVVAVNQSKQPSKLNSQSMSQLNSHSETKVVSQGSRSGSPPKQHVANNGSTVTRSDMNIVSQFAFLRSFISSLTTERENPCNYYFARFIFVNT